ncbi:MAG: hypothetical protein DIU72_002065 [Pseudomonadota bacterium]|nr:MAG: hypothetical protein DIU72_08305 [Pseudomonadota bacterium]
MADTVTTVERTTEFAYLPSDRPLARLSWGGIFIGMISTLALAALFLSLGAAIGLTTLDPSAGWFPGSVGSAIWATVSFFVATFLGAMIGSRASRLYYRSDALAEGFVVWAISMLAAVLGASMLAAFAVQTTTMVATNALQAAALAAQAGGQVLSQAEIDALQQQVMQALPGAAQAQQAGQEAAQAAQVASAAAMWWFFVTGLLSLLAGVLGGLAGIKSKTKYEKPVRYPAVLRPQERPT